MTREGQNNQQGHDSLEGQLFNYNDVFFSYFFDDFRKCNSRCSEFGLNYVLSGEMMLDDGQRQVHVTKGECVFVPRDLTITMYKQPKDGERYQGIFVTFKRELLRDMYEAVGANKISNRTSKLEPGAIKLPKTPELASLFASLVPYFDSEITPSDDIMRLKQQEALLVLLHIDPRFAPTMFDFSEPWKIDILDFLNTHYMYELSTDDMAHYTGRSLATFKRDFKKVSDTTPERWLTRKRLEKAYDLVREGKMQLVDIAYKVGFKSASHFTTAFKRQYGMAPGMVAQVASVG